MFHVKHEGLSSEAAAAGVELTSDQCRRLEAYEQLLADRAAALGMISEGDLPRLRERHVLDCLRAVLAVGEEDRAAADLGSGAGLPGIVVAIARPGLSVALIEARRARAAFLELAAERLELTNVSVANQRAEELSESFDLCFARAFADPQRSWRVAKRLLVPSGRLVYFAGSSFDPGQGVPVEVQVVILPAPPVASAGPLVIMSRQ
jgi:16S rRNA (guanine527-N7)-methyltransferase